MYIGLPICISDFQYVYLTSNIYIGLPISISDFQYLYLTSNIYIRLPIYIRCPYGFLTQTAPHSESDNTFDHLILVIAQLLGKKN